MLLHTQQRIANIAIIPNSSPLWYQYNILKQRLPVKQLFEILLQIKTVCNTTKNKNYLEFYEFSESSKYE